MRNHKLFNYAMVLATIVLALLSANAAADDAFSRDAFNYNPTHRSLSSADDGTKIRYVACTALLSGSLVSYYRLRGKWPATWADVRSEGIFQTDLTTPDGRIIDPDDLVLDFEFDLVYEPSDSADANAYYWIAYDDEGIITNRLEVGIGRTYAEYFEASTHILREKGYDPPVEMYQRYLSDDNMLRLFAILNCLNKASIPVYQGEFGGFPATVEDLIASGFSCVDFDSINPVTGEPFKFDGTPGDIGYMPAIGVFYHVEQGDEYPILRLDY